MSSTLGGSSGPWRLLALALVACGPSITAPFHGGTETGSAQGSDVQGQASATAAVSGAVPTSDSSPPSTGGAPDSGNADTTANLEAVQMYGACEGLDQGDCLPEMLCTITAFGEGQMASICTAVCNDPATDCAPPPSGWSAVCASFLHDDPDPFCAIGCDGQSDCPDEMWCAVGMLYAEPYYCVP